MLKNLFFILLGIVLFSSQIEAQPDVPLCRDKFTTCMAAVDDCHKMYCADPRAECPCLGKTKSGHNYKQRHELCKTFEDEPGPSTGGVKQCEDLWDEGNQSNESLCHDSCVAMREAHLCNGACH